MNIKKITELFCELEMFLKTYGSISIKNQYQIIDNAIAFLISGESDERKFNYAINTYKSLFTGKGGLTEFYIWDDDFDKRQKINQPFEKITNELWDLFKAYI